MTRLEVCDAALGYQDRVVCPEVSVDIPDERFTVIVGPNACGKSTLLKSLARLLVPSAGRVTLDGVVLQELPTKQVARHLGLLPQGPVAPDGIRVVDLVSRGRYPHQGLFTPWSPADEAAVSDAMEATGVHHLSGRMVDELSGGQRQRVWMAVALAQQTSILLLDEPTTFLDLSHQIEHHLFPDIPARRYPQIAAEVQGLCEKYGLPYNTGRFSKQIGSTWGKIFRLAVPFGSSGTSAPTPASVEAEQVPLAA